MRLRGSVNRNPVGFERIIYRQTDYYDTFTVKCDLADKEEPPTADLTQNFDIRSESTCGHSLL